jgi:hypothetical protein
MNQSILLLFRPRLQRLKQHLPSSLFTVVSRFTYGVKPTNSQLKRINLLGVDIGLSENEVVAALADSSSPIRVGGRQKIAVYFSMLVAVVMIAIGSLFIWVILDPETAPIKTYVPGTFYGTIRPMDFQIYGTSRA